MSNEVKAQQQFYSIVQVLYSISYIIRTYIFISSNILTTVTTHMRRSSITKLKPQISSKQTSSIITSSYTLTLYDSNTRVTILPTTHRIPPHNQSNSSEYCIPYHSPHTTTRPIQSHIPSPRNLSLHNMIARKVLQYYKNITQPLKAN